MKNLLALFLFASLLILTGCHTPPPDTPYKVLNVKPDTKLYLAYNLHYRGDRAQSANYQWATFIPVGTEVTIQMLSIKQFLLKDVRTGQELNIIYASVRNGDLDIFLKRLLTAKTLPEQIKGISKETFKKIKMGVPSVGMTKREVILTCGYPPEHRTPSIDCQSWVYWESKFNTFTVIFDENNKVIKISGK